MKSALGNAPSAHLTPAARLAMRLARLQGASLSVIANLAGVSARTAFTVTRDVPKGPLIDKAAEEQLRLVTLAELGISPDHPLAASAWEMHHRHALQLLTIAGEAERTLAARTGTGRAA